MDGNHAFMELAQMSEDERKSVRILWFDKEMLDNLTSENAEEKAEFFNSLSNEEQGELMERGLYTKCGDYTKVHGEFLDDIVERLDNAIEEKMAIAGK